MFGALRVETYRGSRSIEQAQVWAIPPEGYDSPSRATPPPPLTPITFCQVSLTVQRYPYITFVGERRCGRCECLVLEHNTATMPRIEPRTSTLWPPFLIQQKAMNLLYFFQCSPFIYLSCQFLYFPLSINHSFKIAKFKTF